MGRAKKFTTPEAITIFAFSRFRGHRRDLSVRWTFNVLVRRRGLAERSYEAVRARIHGDEDPAGSLIASCSGFTMSVQVRDGPLLPVVGDPQGANVLAEEAWHTDNYANVARFDGAAWSPRCPPKEELDLVPRDTRLAYLREVEGVLDESNIATSSLTDASAAWKGFGGFSDTRVLKAWMGFQADMVRASLGISRASGK